MMEKVFWYIGKYAAVILTCVNFHHLIPTPNNKLLHVTRELFNTIADCLDDSDESQAQQKLISMTVWQGNRGLRRLYVHI